MEDAVKSVLIESFRAKYHRALKKGKGSILGELCEALKVYRKHAIRLLKPLGKKTEEKRLSLKKRGRKSRYDDPEFMKALRGVWMITDQMGPRLLKQSIPAWLPGYERRSGAVTDDVREKLLTISHATIERKLRGTRAKVGKGRCGTKPGNMLRTEIPLRTDFWDVSQPGFVEADTVAHCGGSLMGDFIWSLTVTDSAQRGPRCGSPGTKALTAFSSRYRTSRHTCRLNSWDSTATTVQSS
jgi:hypothetical protein